MNVNIIVFALTLTGLTGAVVLQAGEPLTIIYSEFDEDDTIVESQQNHIDNQRYLQELERSRRERVLERESSSVIDVRVRRYSAIPFSPDRDRGPQHPIEDRFFGMEYQNGTTVLRYYNGYQPNCCTPVYIMQPRKKIDSAVPYRSKKRSGSHR